MRQQARARKLSWISLTYQAMAIRHVDWGVPGQGLAVLVVRPSPQVLDFQADLLAAVSPFTESGGTAEAFDGYLQATLGYRVRKPLAKYVDEYNWWLAWGPAARPRLTAPPGT